MCPDLPTPLTTTRPRQARITPSASRKRSSSREISPLTASASIVSTLRASSSADVEFGVVFLMFSIGLEFSLAKLFQLRRAVFGLGFSQVLLTLGAVLAAASFAGAPWQAALAVGGAIAMSSTAMVMRILAERIQLETPHGRDIVGVLLFQDLAVVPLLILIPAIAEGSGELVQRLGFALAKATVVLVVLLFVGQKLMRGWFHIVARLRSHELFILNVL